MSQATKHTASYLDSLDKELIKGCLSNKRRAQKGLYDKYCDAMYSTAYRITNDKEAASDVLQEAFVKVFQHLSQFRMESSLGAWIKQIVVRTALAHLKNLHFKPSDSDEIITQEVVFSTAFCGEVLEKAILSLSEGYRTVFLLVMVEGYTHKEAAEMLGISEGTSKSQLHYARKLLQKRIGSLEGCYGE